MAKIIDSVQTDEAVEEHAKHLYAKRRLSGSVWLPLGNDHSSGVMPEKLWKKFVPESKEETDPDNYNNQKGDLI